MSRLSMVALILLTGCGHDEFLEATVIEHLYEKSWGGCMSTDWHTRVRDDKGRVEVWCGKLGEVGGKVRAVFTSGHWDYQQNGLHPDRGNRP